MACVWRTRLLLLGAAACAAVPIQLTPGDNTLTVRVENDTIVHIPAGYNNTHPLPIVVALHGLGENFPGIFQKEIKLDAVADATGKFATVYALGSVSAFGSSITGHTWNGGKCCFSGADDFDFLLNVVDAVGAAMPVDRTRVYAVGFSAGGVMAHTLACQAADTFAAVVAVDGPIEVKTTCSPARPVPVLHFHGTLDPVFPFNGLIFNGAKQTFDTWRAVDNCTTAPAESTITTGIKAKTATGCAGGTTVELVSVAGGGHAWPPKRMAPEEYMWSFLSKWALPA